MARYCKRKAFVEAARWQGGKVDQLLEAFPLKARATLAAAITQVSEDNGIVRLRSREGLTHALAGDWIAWVEDGDYIAVYPEEVFEDLYTAA